MCAFIGIFGGTLIDRKGITTQVVTKVSNAALSESEKIAVVNLDAGTEKNKQKIYYAGKIIRYPSDNYQTVSLEEAKNGIENGHFAAYVIIPSTFSESFNSINGTPKKAVIEYKINDSLKNDTKEKMIYELTNFEQSINSNISYVYVNAILEEVHNLQDNAATIMKNDNSDTQSLMNVSAEKLVASITFTEIKDENDPIKMVNLDKESAKMQNAVKSVQNNYDTALKSGQDDFTKIESNSKPVSASLGNVKAEIDAFNPLTDQEGKSYTALGLTSLENEVNASNADITTKREELNNSMVAEINEYAAGQQPRIDMQQEDIDKSISTSVVSDLQKKVDSYLTESNTSISKSIDKQKQAVASAVTDYSSGLQEYVNNRIYSDAAKEIVRQIAQTNAETAFQTEVQMRSEYVENQTTIEAAEKYNEKLDELNEKIAQIQAKADELEKAVKILNGTAEEEKPEESKNPEISDMPADTENPETSNTPTDTETPESSKEAEVVSQEPESSETTNIETAKVQRLENSSEEPVSSIQPQETIVPSQVPSSSEVPSDSEIPTGSETPSSSEAPEEEEKDPIRNITQKFKELKDSLNDWNQLEKVKVPEKMAEPDIHVEIMKDSIDTSSIVSLINLEQAADDKGNPITQPALDMKIDELKYSLSSNDITYKVPDFTLPSVTTIAESRLRSIEKFYELPSDRFTSVIQKNLIDLIQTRNGVLKQNADDKMQEFSTVQKAYQKSLDGFDPYSFVDNDKIQNDVDSISGNLSDITTKMNETSGIYMDYVSDVISKANDNTGKLQDNMMKANKMTARNVMAQMSALKKVRTTNNQTNISLLKGFAGKLSFTRVGKLPHREAYKFIINPITCKNVNNADS